LQGYVAGGSAYPARFLKPDSSTVWETGVPQTLGWTPDTLVFGSEVRLTLEDGVAQVLALGPFPNRTGSATFTPPDGLITSGKYRIKMTHGSMSDIYGYSDSFRIEGMPPDSLEPNDSTSAAKALPAGPERRRLSLHLGDRDLFRVDARKNMLYVAEARPDSGLLATVMGLYTNPLFSPITSGRKDSLSLDSLIRIRWYVAADMPYYLSVSSGSLSARHDHGTYEIGLKEYGQDEFNFTLFSPLAGDTVYRDDTVSVRWSSRLDFGETISVELYRGVSYVQTLVSGAKVIDSHPWKVSGVLTPASDYSLRIRRRVGTTDVISTGGHFTISARP
jgi:hypothetical protein